MTDASGGHQLSTKMARDGMARRSKDADAWLRAESCFPIRGTRGIRFLWPASNQDGKCIANNEVWLSEQLGEVPSTSTASRLGVSSAFAGLAEKA